MAGPFTQTVEENFCETITQVRADLAGSQRKWLPLFVQRVEREGYGASTLLYACAMMRPCIDGLWNGSATMS